MQIQKVNIMPWFSASRVCVYVYAYWLSPGKQLIEARCSSAKRMNTLTQRVILADSVRNLIKSTLTMQFAFRVDLKCFTLINYDSCAHNSISSAKIDETFNATGNVQQFQRSQWLHYKDCRIQMKSHKLTRRVYLIPLASRNKTLFLHVLWLYLIYTVNYNFKWNESENCCARLKSAKTIENKHKLESKWK